jgi:CRISPR/Cas system CMR-associated protein Cmr1 (group 7 of RAMP superfamily)
MVEGDGDLIATMSGGSDKPGKLLQKSALTMRMFGNKFIAPEAKKRNAKVAVYVAVRRAPKGAVLPTEDFTTFLYKSENLLQEEASTSFSLLKVFGSFGARCRSKHQVL